MLNAQECERKIKNQFEVLKRIDTYIGTTNTKCTIIMSYCAAAIAFIFTLLTKFDSASASMQLTVGIGIFSVLALVLALWCMVLATLTIFPVTFSKPDSPRGESLIFFGDIASCGGSAKYSEYIQKASDAEFLEDLNGQIYTLASIATSKFSRIKLVTIILMVHFGCMATVLAGAIIYYLF
ncbi:hypothetical protein FBY06_11481 [Pseudomonas sp. SJZ085]|uniref:Pycsar system effector family protein n=1 Tax=unclassified Pseudomonas TaxID=196821 RepID=UPI001199F058|nr:MULTISPECIES: Pycsar system effector family protein [unclassified Pseudomonas]TWC18626.1 hypothetical protein FBX99_11481 [Pseudomonas sp. SJZ074]TWC36409.1 hypothetical protein FBY06_11481 [Pseudomonas sp. SJZ085]